MLAKRSKGGKRHIATDTLGLLVGLVVHSAGIQDRDGAPDVLKRVAARYPTLRHVFADGGYAGPKLREALKSIGRWTVQIVKRSDTAEGFEVLPRRWVVERTLAWLEDAAASQRTGRNPSQARQRGSRSHTSGASRGCSQGNEYAQKVLNQTLRLSWILWCWVTSWSHPANASFPVRLQRRPRSACQQRAAIRVTHRNSCILPPRTEPGGSLPPIASLSDIPQPYQ